MNVGGGPTALFDSSKGREVAGPAVLGERRPLGRGVPVDTEEIADDDRRYFPGHAEQGRIAGREGGEAVLHELSRQRLRAARPAGGMAGH